MSKIRVVQVSKPGGALELVERDVPQPGRGEVRVRVEACGICHSDAFAKEGYMPGVPYPIVPGHEIAGRGDTVGDFTILFQFVVPAPALGKPQLPTGARAWLSTASKHRPPGSRQSRPGC